VQNIGKNKEFCTVYPQLGINYKKFKHSLLYQTIAKKAKQLLLLNKGTATFLIRGQRPF